MLPAGAPIAAQKLQYAKVAMRLREMRIECERTVVVRFGARELAHAMQRVAEVAVQPRTRSVREQRAIQRFGALEIAGGMTRRSLPCELRSGKRGRTHRFRFACRLRMPPRAFS